MDVVTVNSDWQLLVASDSLQECSGEWKRRLGVPHTDIVTVAPNSEEEAAAFMKFAADKGLTVLPAGSGTQLHIGEAPARLDVLLSSLRLTGVVEHTAGDLTVTVRAGTPFSELQTYLQGHAQFVPITPPCSTDATIGGLVATAVAGPDRVHYGSWRDNVIGLRAVLPTGQVIRTGGKVVKNVAGYDMNKLLVGSHGTLAFLTEVTLKLKPFPKHREVHLIESTEMQPLITLAERVLASECVPSALELIAVNQNDSAFIGADSVVFKLAIGCDEAETAARYQQNRIEQLAEGLGGNLHVTRLAGQDVEQFWNQYRLAWKQAAAEGLLLRGAVPIPQLGETLAQLQNEAAKQGVSCEYAVGLGVGTYRVQLRSADAQKMADVACHLREASSMCGGYLIIEDGSPLLKQSIGVWGKPAGGELLMKAIKQTVDPGSMMSPGRFVGGM